MIIILNTYEGNLKSIVIKIMYTLNIQKLKCNASSLYCLNTTLIHFRGKGFLSSIAG